MSKCMDCVLPTSREVYAIRAVSEGKANSEQQMIALSFIVKHISRAHILYFVPGSHDETAFLAGRAFVGKKVIELCELPMGSIKVIDPDTTKKEDE